MNKFSFILICLTLSSVIVFAQNKFLPAYVIQNDGDTIKGYIEYKQWGQNPEKINFKADLLTQVEIFKPLDIKAFFVQNELYRSAIIFRETGSNSTMNLKVGGDLDLKQDTTFLKALFIGEKSLFFLLDKNKKEQFYIPIDTGYDLLIYKRYLKNTGQEMRPGEGSQIIENARYKGQLLNYMKDCNSIVPMISKTAYTQKDLYTLFDSYYKCVPSGIKYKSTQEKVSTKYSILAGMSMTTMNFKSDMYKVLRQTEFSPSYNLYVGFRFDFIFPRNFNKWSAGIELGNSSYKFNGIHNEYESAQVYTITETNISASYLKINSILNYSEFFGKYKATWDLGYSYGRAYNLTNLQTKETKIYTTERTESIPVINEIRRFEQGLLFGMSLKYSFFSVGLRYEGGNGFSNSSNIGTRTNRFYGLLIFTFK